MNWKRFWKKIKTNWTEIVHVDAAGNRTFLYEFCDN